MAKKTTKKVLGEKQDTQMLNPDGSPALNKNGDRRGMHRSRNRATQLLDLMQERIKERFGIENFDPVVALVELGVENSTDHIKLDHKGDVEYHLDDDGHPKLHAVTGEPIPVIVPADHAIAHTCFGKAAPYVRSTLKQIELTDKSDGPIDADVAGAKERLAEMAGMLDEAAEDDDEPET